MDADLIINLIMVFVLLVLLSLGTFFSAAEMAFSSLRRPRLKAYSDAPGKRGKRAAQALLMYETKFDSLVSTLLICNNLVAIISTTVSVALFIRLVGEQWGYIIATFVISAVVIVLTDIFPKSLSKEQPENVAIFAVPFVKLLVTLLTPITHGVIKMKNGLSNKFARAEEEQVEENQGIVGQELIFMVEEAEKEGSLNEDDSLLITNAIEFNDVLAWDIITPRVNISSIPITSSIQEVADIFQESGHSRMPVYEDNLDQIRGIIHIRDFMRCITPGPNNEPPLTLEDVVTPALFTVTSARVSDVMQLMKREKAHMVIVADEYGGTEGLVTMEDILEQLVGDIWDENDEILEEFQDLGSGRHKISCTALVIKMFEYFDIEAESESNTVCGWIMDELRRVPAVGDSFKFENLNVTVTKANERRAEECEIVVDDTTTSEEAE